MSQDASAADELVGVEAMLDRLRAAAEGRSKVTVGDIVATLGARGYGPLLFVPALVELSPIGGIPGVPTVLALIVGIFAAQIALGRRTLWLPGFLTRAGVSEQRMTTAIAWLRPVGRWMDRWFRGRLAPLVREPVIRVAAVICVALCLMTPPLELLPFASTGPMATIGMFGLAMTLKDGLLMVAGFVLTAGVAVGGVSLLVW